MKAPDTGIVRQREITITGIVYQREITTIIIRGNQERMYGESVTSTKHVLHDHIRKYMYSKINNSLQCISIFYSIVKNRQKRQTRITFAAFLKGK